MPDLWDDEQLLAVLKESLLARREVPAEFTEAARNAFAWRNIDAELAELTYDSLAEAADTVSVRSETASIRALTFTSDHLSIEIEVNEDSLLCQLVPTDGATVELQTRAGETTRIAVDEMGCFTVRPVPAVPFRLHCQMAGGATVVTGWITLLPARCRRSDTGTALVTRPVRCSGGSGARPARGGCRRDPSAGRVS